MAASYVAITLLIVASIVAAFGSLVIDASNVGTMVSPARTDELTIDDEAKLVCVGIGEKVATSAAPEPGTGSESVTVPDAQTDEPLSIVRASRNSTMAGVAGVARRDSWRVGISVRKSFPNKNASLVNIFQISVLKSVDHRIFKYERRGGCRSLGPFDLTSYDKKGEC